MTGGAAWVLLVGSACLAGAAGCGSIDDNPSNPLEGKSDTLIVMEVAPDTAPVGIAGAVRVTASVTRDATSQTCTFTSTAGKFGSPSGAATATATVDSRGQASVTWYPPDQMGTVDLTAQVASVTGRTSVVVKAVPDILFVGLLDTMAKGQVAAFMVQVDPAWSGAALDLKTSAGTLLALGPVRDELDEGSRVRPLLDQTGRAEVLLTAPGAAGNVVVAGSLFGTVRTRRVQVP